MTVRMSFVCVALAVSVRAQTWTPVPAFSFQAQQTARDDVDYRAGLSELDARQWEQAISAFAASAARNQSRADAALYWKAYAQKRAGQGEPALLTVAELRRRYPASRWIKDARALELEVRAQAGLPVSPGAEQDEDLKMLALNSLMQADPSAAFPLIQEVLTSDNPEGVKEQALFVLTQSGSPEANKLLGQIASGGSNPALQIKAIHMMGMMGDKSSRKALTELYRSSPNIQVKGAILESFMQSGSRDFLLSAVKSETNPQLREEAIGQIALTGGREELWQLYGASRSTEEKKEILQSMFLSGDSSRLTEVARNGSDPQLRVAAIRSLGLMGSNGRSDVLVSIFENDKDRDVREAALNALFIRRDAKALIALARREKDPQVKKEIISRLGLIHSPEVTDYMTEILK